MFNDMKRKEKPFILVQVTIVEYKLDWEKGQRQ